MHRQPHSPYYRDRDSEYDLCNDFPGDEILIDGLHAMQLHFWNNNVNVEIPVVRVMNTAHYIAAYMFATTCSGDQMEYDVMAYDSLSRDKQLTRLTMIVLAAMLRRTEGFRARSCRNLILDNRDPDFDEGVTLYDRFLRSAEERFTEVMVSPLSGVEKCLDLALRTEETMRNVVSTIDHLDGRGIDILLRQQQEISRLTSENIQLKYTLTKMENQQNNQFNNCVIYNAPVYNTNTTNNNYYQQPAESPKTEPVQEEVSVDFFKYIHVNVTDDKERADIHKMVYNIVRLPKMQLVCDELYKLMKNGKVLCTINPEAMLGELRRMGLPSADTSGFSDKNFYYYYKAPKLD